MKSPVYGDPERIKKKLKDIEELYDNYIDILPEEELLTIDIIERTLNFISEEKKEDLVEIVYEDYLNQVLKKEEYTLNDLLLIKYYTFQCQVGDYDKEIVESFRCKLINQELQGEELVNVELLGALSTIGGIYVMHHDYRNMKTIVDKMHTIIDKTLQHAYKPAVLILEAKYYLYFENDLDKAREIYNTAQVLSQAFGDEVFIKNLKMEMEKDLNIK